MVKKVNISVSDEILYLDISDAMMATGWPSGIPDIIPIRKGVHSFDYDIIENAEWGGILRNFVNSMRQISDTIPIGVSKNSLPIGSFIKDSTGNILVSGRDKEVYLKEIKDKKEKHDGKVLGLKLLYPYMDDKYIIDYSETIDLLFDNINKKDKGMQEVYDIFNDVLLSGGGSTYSSGDVAALGAWSSVIDYKVLGEVFKLFNKEDLVSLSEALLSMASYSPLHSVMNGQLNTYMEKLASHPPKVGGKL